MDADRVCVCVSCPGASHIPHANVKKKTHHDYKAQAASVFLVCLACLLCCLFVVFCLFVAEGDSGSWRWRCSLFAVRCSLFDVRLLIAQKVAVCCLLFGIGMFDL